MPCFAPLEAYYSAVVGPSGKRGVTFDRNASFSGSVLKLPCGQCIGCRLERSRQWAMRCMHEKRFHRNSEFVTLTYEDSKLPEYGTLVKRDLQLFNKRARKAFGPFRFYACGEYGEQNGRPHYHSIMFGLELGDKRFYKRGKNGEDLYTSKSLERVWNHGLCVVGSVTFESCAYVARYIVDKITGERARDHYSIVDSDGIVHDRVAEFNVMSRRPGIGMAYYEKYGHEVYAHDSVVVNGREVRPPRFYDTKYEKVSPDQLTKLKKKRRRKALASRGDNTRDRLRVRAEVARLSLKLKSRSVT